ncbi:MAG TPA: Fis family transcriptional regulator [Candidatus Rokubacteria bacterium]|nr:MAG: Fis family transcriptional regulator [Candidatus Rokubacteria bacterium GWA2_73_35]HBH03921.1 Fis family transcriptional regulator [Candidatus Rokubacteria bacterium]
MDNRKTRILVVDDEEIVRESMAGWLEKDGYTVATAPDGPTAVERLRAEPWSILLVDLKMPGMDGLGVLEEARKLRPDAVVVIMTAYATVDTAVTAMKMGAFDYLVKPFDPEELSLLTQKIVAQQALARENILLRKVLKREYRFRDLLSNSPKMHAVFDLARVAARSHSTILVQGESGTGKELLARAIHVESPRSTGPFVAVSCAALTETLLESELFGHEKGAFTGAVSRRKGKFEAAHGGTLFLDEIGDVSPKLQLDLLRVLEERRFSRVGGTESIQVDVRIIAATNRDLKKALEDGRFREDLYYRLNVIPITLPPLRQRREDLPLLVEHFLEHLGVELGRKLEAVSAEGMRLLTAHDWPGNVRELRNVLERAAVVASGPILDVADLGLLEVHTEERQGSEGLASLEEVERRHIAEVLRRTGGNVSHAARILGIDRVTLYSKIKRYELRKEPESGT